MIPTLPHVDLNTQGFALLDGVFPADVVEEITHSLEAAFHADARGHTLRCADGRVYGARNLLQLCPEVATFWIRPPVPELLAGFLGPDFGLVRVLYFDKPPQHSWALPWHKDYAIAVRDNRLPSPHFCRPTTKIGVPHVGAPTWLLEKMLTVRLHLDDMTNDNGPLQVMVGSHRDNPDASGATQGGPEETRNIATILGRRGDVLLMRPLLSHCSNRSRDGTNQHRRILHYEFSGVELLPDGYAWHDFIRPHR